MIRLTVKDGSIVQTLTLDEEKVFIGRLDSNTIRLESASVSRKHGLIRRNESGRLEILDLNSRHGIRRNGETVERAPIDEGDLLELGEVRIRVEALDGAPPEEYTLAPPEPETGEGVPPPSPPARESKELISNAHRTTFNEELFRQMRRTPWWAASVLLHVLFVYVFFLVPFQEPEGATPFGSVNGNLAQDWGPMLDDSIRSADEMLEDLVPDIEDVPPPSLDEAAPPLVEPNSPEEEFAPVPEVGPAAADFASRLRNRDDAGISIPDAEFGQSGADGANREAIGLLKKSLARRGGGPLGLLKRLTREELLVVEGHYDKVETILDLLEIKYGAVTVRHLDRTSLDGVKVVFVNCSNEPPSDASVKRLKDFVRGGGYLLTTDWGLENVLRKAFPTYVRPLTRRGRNVITPNEVIRIHAVPNKRDHFLLAGTHLQRGQAKWWLEESSYPIEVLNSSRVETLIESDDLDREYGSRPVAVTFRFGKGRVLHMMGHFYQKEGNLKGTFSTQRLIANFLISALRRR